VWCGAGGGADQIISIVWWLSDLSIRRRKAAWRLICFRCHCLREHRQTCCCVNGCAHAAAFASIMRTRVVGLDNAGRRDGMLARRICHLSA